MEIRSIASKLVLVMLGAALLSGCITSIAPVQPLPRESIASVYEVALAVDGKGFKHYAWTECFGDDLKVPNSYTCVLVYSRVATGAVLYRHGFVQTIGKFARYPDVAVTDNGDAYVVWSECTDFSSCVDYWTVFVATHPENVEPQAHLLHTSAALSEGPPVVEGRGTDVYAAYLVNAGGVRLRYRHLAGGPDQTGLIDTALLLPQYPSLAIDSNGDLHAVWLRNMLTDTTVAYANNVAAGGNNFNAPTIYEADLNTEDLITAPRLALANNNRAYLAYAVNYGASNTESIVWQCRGTAGQCYGNVVSTTVPLVNGPWNVYGEIDLEVLGDQPNLVFAATHNGLTASEVWWYHPGAATLSDPPARVTFTANQNETSPLIVEENSNAGPVPVIAWREFEPLFLNAPTVVSGPCMGDVYYLYAYTSNTQRVFTDRGTCDNAGFDLAANGEWVAGVWIDEHSDALPAHAAWTTFNTYRTEVPQVNR